MLINDGMCFHCKYHVYKGFVVESSIVSQLLSASLLKKSVPYFLAMEF